MKRWNQGIWIGVWGILLIVSLYFRTILWNLGLEYDEVFTAITSNPLLSWSWIWKHWLLIDVHPPLHNFILYLWNFITPYGSEIWLRFPSILFSICSLVLAWLLCPRRWGKVVRMAFVLLIATNGYMIIYSQQARAYALMLCLAIPVTFLFLKIARLTALHRSIHPFNWTLFGLLSLLLCWSHYFGALLFGMFAVLLFVQAYYYKRPLKPFILVPALVVLLFLPWLVPNLWINIGLHRFQGDWWGNTRTWEEVPRKLTIFFFTSFISAPILGCLGLVGILHRIWQYRKKRVCVYIREIVLLLTAVLGVLTIAFLVSLKMHVVIGRYFTEILPAFYLAIVLLIAPLLRKSNIVCLLFTVALVASLRVYYKESPSFLHPFRFSARITASFWKDIHPGEDLWVASISGYPPPAMEAMYGYYLNDVWHQQIQVKELYQLPAEERNKLLEQYPEKLIYMPSCQERELNQLYKKWNRLMAIRHIFGASCYVQVSKEGETRDPRYWFNEKGQH